MLERQRKRYKRHRRVRAKTFGTAERPRLCVFRSARHIYAQLINDERGETVVAASDREIEKKIKERKRELKGKTAEAYEVGRLIAKRAIKKKIERVVFDRGGYKYHGRVKVLAEGAREEGLKF